MVLNTLKKWLLLGVSAVKMRQPLKQKMEKRWALFNSSGDSDNLGDYIIMRFCRKELSSLLDMEQALLVPTHTVPNNNILDEMAICDRKIVCGTNLLFPELEHASIWKFPSTFESYNNCVLMGTGWGYYSGNPSFYSKIFYRMILNKKGLHAVRDLYTCEKLKRIGIKNVLYTGCPTMWGLTPEVCNKIPMEKGVNVVTTVTSYSPDKEVDAYMIETLCNNYKNVYFWPQGIGDREYVLSFLQQKDNLVILDRSLEAFDKVLQLPSIDYIGTRLHGGVQALNAGKRSLIIAIDNRAKEIGKDTRLPILNREEVKARLKSTLLGQYKTEIKMPFKNIENWKKQFMEK